MLPLLKKQ